jgi:hypothetical protein
VDAGSVLGLPALRTTLLVDVSPTKPREAEAGERACLMTTCERFPLPLLLDDDDLDDEDEEDFDEDDEDDKEGDEDEEDSDDEEPETWQVHAVRR